MADRIGLPFAHGEWLRSAVPDATAWFFDNYGHISLMTRIRDVQRWLLSHES